MTNSVAGDIEQARYELDQAIDEMKAAIRLCEQMHNQVGSVKSTGELDKLMHASFKADPIAYSLMAFSNVLVAIDEDTEHGWTGRTCRRRCLLWNASSRWPRCWRTSGWCRRPRSMTARRRSAA